MSDEASVQRLLALLSEEEGARSSSHPTAEELMSYDEGRLSAEEAERVQGHLVACDGCRALLLDLANLEGLAPAPGSAGSSDAEATAAFAALRSRLSAEPPQARGVPWSPFSLSHPFPLALAASLLACIGLGALAVSAYHQAARPARPQLNDTIVDLFQDPLRSSDPRAATLTPPRSVVLPPGASQLTLILHLAGAGPEEELGVQIETRDGKVVWKGHGLAVTPERTSTLSLDRRFLPAGEYRIVLYRFDKDEAAQPAAAYSFLLTP